MGEAAVLLPATAAPPPPRRRWSQSRVAGAQAVLNTNSDADCSAQLCRKLNSGSSGFGSGDKGSHLVSKTSDVRYMLCRHYFSWRAAR